MAQQRLERKEYLDKLIGFRDKQLIKVVTGVRRCGKSTLLEIYQDYLRSNGVEDNQILSINRKPMSNKPYKPFSLFDDIF